MNTLLSLLSHVGAAAVAMLLLLLLVAGLGSLVCGFYALGLARRHRHEPAVADPGIDPNRPDAVPAGALAEPHGPMPG